MSVRRKYLHDQLERSSGHSGHEWNGERVEQLIGHVKRLLGRAKLSRQLPPGNGAPLLV